MSDNPFEDKGSSGGANPFAEPAAGKGGGGGEFHNPFEQPAPAAQVAVASGGVSGGSAYETAPAPTSTFGAYDTGAYGGSAGAYGADQPGAPKAFNVRFFPRLNSRVFVSFLPAPGGVHAVYEIATTFEGQTKRVCHQKKTITQLTSSPILFSSQNVSQTKQPTPVPPSNGEATVRVRELDDRERVLDDRERELARREGAALDLSQIQAPAVCCPWSTSTVIKRKCTTHSTYALFYLSAGDCSDRSW